MAGVQAERIDEVAKCRCVGARSSAADHTHSNTETDRKTETQGRGEHEEPKQAIEVMVTTDSYTSVSQSSKKFLSHS